jgi:putative nucleotidyltransferase with HDIG domain
VRAAYRFRQGLKNLAAEMRPEDWALAGRHLSERERALFDRMEPADQRHSVEVLKTLLRDGIEDQHLLEAALLHDVGKSRSRITVVHRTLAVLAKALFGRWHLITAWPSESGWWTPFHVMSNHPRIGASMLAKAGCEERVWRLVELHQVPVSRLGQIPDEDWVRWALEQLRSADERN